MSDAKALRIIGREMQDRGIDFRTDEIGIEALVLLNAADLIDDLQKRLADREAEVESLSYRLYNGRH